MDVCVEKSFHGNRSRFPDWSKHGDDTVIVRIVPKRSELAQRLAGRGRKYLRAGANPIQDLIDDRVREDKEERTS